MNDGEPEGRHVAIFEAERQPRPVTPGREGLEVARQDENPVEQDRAIRFPQDPNVNAGGVSDGSG